MTSKLHVVHTEAGPVEVHESGDGKYHDGVPTADLAFQRPILVGFGAFGLADSAGLRGMGLLAVLGIAMTTLAALLVMPLFRRP